eukprot:CAMPEP_0114517632 /NCGR_PEP_ID=MMETSP0109-20121206/17999_1 /TAXON_ID=29199 /ORGANISM="Chlorarachnion reptans, Strain CCCM449" /LENGTH=493 /DNA_ID=CAMNT_0001698169 /DNA_START=217 /DNA_END=1698 /DNA_ORIENTATION=+
MAAAASTTSKRLAQDVRERAYATLLDSHKMFLANYSLREPLHLSSHQAKLAIKIGDEYSHIQMMPPPKPPLSRKRIKLANGSASTSNQDEKEKTEVKIEDVEDENMNKAIEGAVQQRAGDKRSAGALVEYKAQPAHKAGAIGGGMIQRYTAHQQLILKARSKRMKKPVWHAPWKLMRVISGHLGWVRAVAVDPTNEWFATGSGDRTIKIWDLASGTLKLTLTGHINSVTDLAVSHKYPYLFSVGNDKLVKCWDLEQNKVVRHYHGHLSGVFSCAIHPTLDLLVTGGRDSVARVWDIRTKAEAMVLGGHTNCVSALGVQGAKPQVITGSHDNTVRLWDLTKGATHATLTNHKKSVRSLLIHPKEYTFCTGAADNLKVWKCPDGVFMRNISGHAAIVNTIAINRDNVLVSGADNGTLHFWDWKSGWCFQNFKVKPQPGSLDSECGIFKMAFDMTGSRLITCEADKSIKVWKEDETATPETHPLNWKPSKRPMRGF